MLQVLMEPCLTDYHFREKVCQLQGLSSLLNIFKALKSSSEQD